MKKLVSPIILIVCVSMVSCTSNNAEQAEVTEDTSAVVEECIDTTIVALDSAADVCEEAAPAEVAGPDDGPPPQDSITGD